MSKYIHWDKKLETGHPLLDAEHRLLVMLFRKLDIAIKTRQSDKTISRVVLEVKKFAEFHFISEENLMLETGYPDFNAHKKIHSDLMEELSTMISRVVSHHEYPENLLDFLNWWLTDHIANHDQHITKYIQDSSERPVGESIYTEYFPS